MAPLPCSSLLYLTFYADIGGIWNVIHDIQVHCIHLKNCELAEAKFNIIVGCWLWFPLDWKQICQLWKQITPNALLWKYLIFFDRSTSKKITQKPMLYIDT